MKKNIVILSILSFLFLSGLLYYLTEVIYNERLSRQENNSESDIVSYVELISPEIRTALVKSDDIALLYSIEKISKIKNVKEVFIIDSGLNILIHNDSSKWNKLYDDDIYKKIVKQKNKSLQRTEQYTFIYSQPLNDNSVFCVKYSMEDAYSYLRMWKIKLYVYCFIIAFLMLFIVYYLSKFFFLRPFNKAKKYLSVNEIGKKTIYSDIVNMALACVPSSKSGGEDNNRNLKNLLNIILKNYLTLRDEIFIILDSQAKLIYGVDENNIVLQKHQYGEHIVSLTTNSEILKNVSVILEDPKQTLNVDVSDYKINITPLTDETNEFTGIIISGNSSGK